MAKCLERLRAKRKIATLENRKKVMVNRSMIEFVNSAIEINKKDIQEYVSGNAGLLGKFVGTAVLEYSKRFSAQPSAKQLRFVINTIEAILDSHIEKAPTPTFSELRANENRPSSLTKERRKLHRDKRFNFKDTFGNKLPNMGARIPRKLKKQIKTLARKQYEAVAA